MKRAVLALVLAGGLIGAGCSGGAGVARKAGAATARPADSPTERPDDGPVVRLVEADGARSLSGQPGGMSADDDGAVVEVDDNTVVAFDTEGQERWSASVPGAALGWPLLTDRLVVVPTLTGSDLGESSDYSHSGAGASGGCVALDRSTGARRWAYEEAGKSGVAVAAAGSRVFCVFKQGVIVAVDRDTGKLLWRSLVDARLPSAPVSVAERTAIVIDTASGTMAFTTAWGNQYELIVRELSTGADPGSFGLGPGPVSAPVVVGPGVVGVGTKANVCSLDLRRREVITCADVEVSDGFDPASIPVVADGRAVFAARNGELIAIDIKTWKMVWGKKLPTAILDARPGISEGVLLFADFSRIPWAFRMSDGSKVEVPTPDGFLTAIATDPAEGFAVAVRGHMDGSVNRWVPQR